MKNTSTGTWDWWVTIAGKAVWNQERHGYDYEVKDSSGVKVSGMIPEPNLKEA